MFSLNHSSIGRSTHGSGTAGAHMEYVTRESACTKVMGQNMPVPRPGRVRRTRAWMDRQERADRKNARVIDKIMLALPRELDAERRVELIRRFAEELTGGQTPWLAAFHDKGRDAHNPHCHFVLRDRHVDTGKRVVGMSEKGSTERVRQLWERLANDALAAAGSTTRIDRRSLAAQRADKLDQAARCEAQDLDRAAHLRTEAQDLDRAPQAHLGPKARAVKAEGRHSTKIARIEEAQEARRRAERAQEAREAREAAGKAREAETALREAQIAAESRERARREDEGAAERRRAALEALEAREATQVAKEAERALQASQIAATRREAAERARIEAPIARSRARVLRARGLANTVTGFLRNVRQGTAMLDPFPQDQLSRATRSLLSWAGELLRAWQAFREGRHDGGFREAEQGFTEAGADLAEMHMVLAPPRRLTGAELDDELRRLRDLEAFPDQGLLRPAMGAARGRIAKIERYAQTPEGAAKMAAHRRAEAGRVAAEEREAERRREARRAQERGWAEDQRRHDAELVRPFVERARTDSQARVVVARWIDLDRPAGTVLHDPRWQRLTDDGRTVWYRVQGDLEDLDRRRERSRPASEPAPVQPAPRPESERDRSTQRLGSQPDPEPKPPEPPFGRGPSGPRM